MQLAQPKYACALAAPEYLACHAEDASSSIHNPSGINWDDAVTNNGVYVSVCQIYATFQGQFSPS